jgi:hypothetical protein
MEKTISCDDTIREISEMLAEADGEYIAKVYTDLSGNKEAEYIGDSLITIFQELRGKDENRS